MNTLQLSLEDAVNVIFGYKYNDDVESCMKNLKLDDLKKAFRNKVKVTHPDMASILGIDKIILENEFKKLHEAYTFLTKTLKEEGKNHSIRQKTTYYGNNRYNHTEKKYKKSTNNNKQNHNFYYTGDTPKRRLRFAEFLFYTGQIGWYTLIDALVWQYKNRPKFGEIALKLGYLNQSKLDVIIRNSQYNEKIGDVAVRLGFMNEYQLHVILGRQKNYNMPIGRYFITKKLLTEGQIEQKLFENRLHNLQCRIY